MLKTRLGHKKVKKKKDYLLTLILLALPPEAQLIYSGLTEIFNIQVTGNDNVLHTLLCIFVFSAILLFSGVSATAVCLICG